MLALTCPVPTGPIQSERTYRLFDLVRQALAVGPLRQSEVRALGIDNRVCEVRFAR